MLVELGGKRAVLAREVRLVGRADMRAHGHGEGEGRPSRPTVCCEWLWSGTAVIRRRRSARRRAALSTPGERLCSVEPGIYAGGANPTRRGTVVRGTISLIPSDPINLGISPTRTGLRRALRGEFGGPLPGRTVASCASRPPPLCSSREGASTVVLGFLRFHRVRILAPRPCCSSSSPSGRRAGASKMDCSVSRCCATRCRDSSGSGYRS